ncbi:MAG: S-layer homology domain-containing protein [Chloroflexota bacterium]|nr:S-layer homology domain-containing protein [Chloroflexota bacterium]
MNKRSALNYIAPRVTSLLFLMAAMGTIGTIPGNASSQGVAKPTATPTLSTQVTPSQTTAVRPKAPATSSLQYGFVMALLSNNITVKNMGFNWVQYGAYWKDAEPNPGQYDWGNVDNVVNSARNAHIGVVIRVSRPPTWARDPNCAGNDTCPPANAADFGNFVQALAAHARSLTPYPLAYEIWNEPNTGEEWGQLCPDPNRYTDLLRAAYPHIKNADPSALVVGGVVSTVGETPLSPMCHMDDMTFLNGMYQAGAAPYFDILSDHPYGYISAPETDPSIGTRLVFRRAEEHRQLMVQYGDAAKQIWATEIGWAIDPATEGSSCGRPDWYFVFSPQQQADYLVRAYNWAKSYWPWMGAMFVFNFDFNQAPWYQQCDAFRFWAVSNRPARAALQNFVQNPPATYTPVPSSPTPTRTTTPLPDLPPGISAVRYSATTFTRTGGTLTVDVDATDNDSTPIDTVNANVLYPDGSTQLYSFSLVGGDNRAGTWRAAVNIGANSTNGDQTYTVSPFAVESYPYRRTASAASQAITVTNTRFWDVSAGFWAYQYIEYLANAGVISGYGDDSFRPGNPASRAQLTKIVVLGYAFPIITPGEAHFEDVPEGSTFYGFVETAADRGLVGGYACGRSGEPCDAQNRAYFRPGSSVSRGQISKIVVVASSWTLLAPQSATFSDVPHGSTFYPYVETAYAHNILGGYACGGPAEPCGPQNQPYFRPGATTTRAQICKLVYLAVTSGTGIATATPSATATSVGQASMVTMTIRTATSTIAPASQTPTRTVTP